MKVRVRDSVDRAQLVHQIAFGFYDLESQFRKMASTNKALLNSGLLKQMAELNEVVQRWAREAMTQEQYGGEYTDADGTHLFESPNLETPAAYSMDARARRAYDSVLKQMSQDADRFEKQREIGIKIMHRFNPHYRNKK